MIGKNEVRKKIKNENVEENEKNVKKGKMKKGKNGEGKEENGKNGKWKEENEEEWKKWKKEWGKGENFFVLFCFCFVLFCFAFHCSETTEIFIGVCQNGNFYRVKDKITPGKMGKSDFAPSFKKFPVTPLVRCGPFMRGALIHLFIFVVTAWNELSH